MPEKPRIGIITSWDKACGIAEYSRSLAEALRPWVDVNIYPLPEPAAPRVLRRLGGQVSAECRLAHIQHEYIFFGGRDPWNNHYRHLTRALSIPHVVTIHTWLKPFPGGGRLKAAVKGLRDGVYQKAGWTRYLQAGQFAASRAVIVMSSAFGSALAAQGLGQEKIHVLPQGVPAARPGDPDRGRRQWGWSGPVVVIFGFLNPAKGHLLALRAWKRMPHPPLLVIAGGLYSEQDAAYQDELRKAAQPLGAQVRFTGYLDAASLADLLAAAEVVLLPYLSSTSSYSLSLALAAGRPVLASDLECFREVRREQACLELFPTGNAEALAQAVENLLADAPRRKQLQAAARAWAEAHAWPTVAEKTAGIYQEVMKA